MRQFRQEVPVEDDGDDKETSPPPTESDSSERQSRSRTRNPPLERAFLPRRASLEGADERAVMTQRRRKKESFYPRRRFSNSAIEPIREILEEIEEEEKAAWEKVMRSLCTFSYSRNCITEMLI